ncbi:MAG: FHA domain-containing protein [Myxococcota bacterium]|nr:FHA domain-containing protein [Myxococcota bacterium]
MTVGRAPECNIRSEDPRVSRMHARFFVDQGGLWIEDLGSTHGIYVGPNKVQRAPVPPGEVVLIGSLLVRLVPQSGTMPPPMGLHGTLATWLDLERKNRVTVEEERDAFAKRVGELHQELAAAKNAPRATPRPEESPTDTSTDMAGAGMMAEAVRMRDEAEARSAALERALAVVQDELMVLRETSTGDTDEDVRRLRAELASVRERLVDAERDLADRAEWSTLVGAEHTKLSKELEQVKVVIDEAMAARSVAEHAAGEAARESQALIQQMDELRRASAADLEIARMEAAKARDGKNVSEMTAGLDAVEKLAAMDLEIEALKRQLAAAKAIPKPPDSDARVQELTETLAVLTARAEKAEKDLGAAQIRAQGAERNLSHATSQSAKAETRVAQLEEKIADAEAQAKAAEADVAKSREKITALETRVGAGDAPLVAAEGRAAKIAAELENVTQQYETSRGRIVELEAAVQVAEKGKRDADQRADTIKSEIAAAQLKLADAEKRGGNLQAKLDDLSKADAAIAAAAKAREEAALRVAAMEQQVTDANRRVEDAVQRASAADTMAKAMAKDVAEALRRAADADTKTRATGREVAELVRRADAAETANASSAATIKAAEDRAVEAEARVEVVRKEVADQLEAMQKELAARLEATQKDLGTKLEAAQRELAAERKTSLGLVDRKTHLERELAEARAALPAAVQRAEAAEQRVVEHEVQIEALQDRVTDLESSLAVAETASQASRGESAETIAKLETHLAELKQASGKGGEIIADLRTKIDDLEKRLAEVTRDRDEAREALRRTTEELTEAIRAAEQNATSTEDDRERLDDALRRAADAERKVDALATQAETADLAIGRAGALQRQLDEALSKLAWLERDSSRPREIAHATPRPEVSEKVVNDRIEAAENKVKEIEAQLADAERRAKAARDEAVNEAATTATALEQRHQQQLQAQLQQFAELEQRAATAEAQAEESERRTAEAEMQISELQARVTELAKRPVPNPAFEQQLFDAQRKIAELEREVANADNVRSFAAETEREIAQLQRDLRDAKSKVTQLTLERDRLAADLRNARGDSETTNRRAPLDRSAAKKIEPDYDPEVTAQADVSKYEPIIAKANELQQKVNELTKQVLDHEKQSATLRVQLKDTEERLRQAIDRDDDDDGVEQTHTGSQLPIAFAEHLSILEESIDSLRANMRAASDETAMMDQSDSVVAVSAAVSQAAEHVERARAAIRAMNASIGIS